MNRLKEIRDTVNTIKNTAMNASDLTDKEYIEDTEYLLNEVERYKNGLKEISRYTHPDYPFKGETLISEIHTLTNLALKE